ncbi:MAG TPA: spore maturation protein [Clostridia bacterium]|nr:spore maturation protein [Clostridia bacterium]
MIGIISFFSKWVIPFMFMIIPLLGWLKGIDVYEAFIDGAKEGVKTAVRILPYIVSMLFAISIFRTSGALDLLVQITSPVLNFWGIPGECIPLMFLRPLSGTGALGYTTEILNTYGPDSFLGRLVSCIQGSTDTTFYILTVYFGSVGIKRFRHSVFAGLAADIAGFIMAIMMCKIFFQ